MVQKIILSLSLRIATQTLRSKDTRQTLQTIFGQWLSLSTCTFQAVVEIIPPPFVAQRLRVPKIIYPDLVVPTHSSSGGETQGITKPKDKLEEDLYNCKGDGVRVVAFISKMFAVPRQRLPRDKEQGARTNAADVGGGPAALGNLRLDEATIVGSKTQSRPETDRQEQYATNGVKDADEEEEVLLGFARLYSGTLTVPSSELFVVLPKYNTSLPPTHSRNKPFVLGPVRIASLYEMMGRDLVRVEAVQAGSVFAVEGLEGVVGRSGTLISGPSPGANGEGGWVNLAGLGSEASYTDYCSQRAASGLTLVAFAVGGANSPGRSGTQRTWLVDSVCPHLPVQLGAHVPFKPTCRS